MEQAYDDGDLKKAVFYAKHLSQVDPIYENLIDYALVSKESGLYKQAIRTLDQAINLDITIPDAHIEKALILYETDETLRAYNYILSLRATLLDDTPWALLAVLAGELQHLQEALFYANKAVNQLPDAWSFHARAIVHQLQKAYLLANEDFQTALSCDPYNPELWNSYGLFFEECMAFERALEVYDTAINQFELTAHFLYLNRAKIHHILGHKEHSLYDCEQALEQIPDSGDIWFLFATILHEQGDFLSALHAYNQSLRYIKKDASIHFCKAQVLEALGNIKQAKTSYQHAVKLDKSNTEIRLAFATFLIKHNLSLQAHALIREGIDYADNTASLERFLQKHDNLFL